MQTPWWNSEIEKAVGQLAMEGGEGGGKGEGVRGRGAKLNGKPIVGKVQQS